MLSKQRSLLAMAAVSLLGLGCDGLPNLTGNNNTEPVAQFMPDDVTLDVSELPDDSTSAKTKNSALPNPETERRGNALNTCGGVVHGFHRAAARALALSAKIHEDMSSPDNVLVAGEFDNGHKSVKYLADFSAFDFDGDGAADGSGNAVDEPVALRLWTDRGNGYEQFLCALITTKPTEATDDTEANLGAGAAYIKPAGPHEDEAADLQIYVIWDRTDPTHKWNEAFITGHLGGRFGFDASHHRVDHLVYEDGHIEKTVRTSATFADNPFDFDVFKSSVHFSVGSHAALFSIETTGPSASITFTNNCVNFETKELDPDACADFDTGDLEFILEPEGDETTFPESFPAKPTFTEEEADNAGANDNSNGNTDDDENENDDDDANDNDDGNENDNTDDGNTNDNENDNSI